MANVKQGQTVRPPQWWKHLRGCKRIFWKRQRRDNKRLCNEVGRVERPDQRAVTF